MITPKYNFAGINYPSIHKLNEMARLLHLTYNILVHYPEKVCQLPRKKYVNYPEKICQLPHLSNSLSG